VGIHWSIEMRYLKTNIVGCNVLVTVWRISKGQKVLVFTDTYEHTTKKDALECERAIWQMAQVANWVIEA
jgi:hypothetical protein